VTIASDNAALAASRPEQWQRQRENTAIRTNVCWWRALRQLGLCDPAAEAREMADLLTKVAASAVARACEVER